MPRLTRPPAVPLVAVDPFTNAWSMSDRLTDDWPRHWTGARMALFGAVRVDGEAFRFMGSPEWLGERVAEQISVSVGATRTDYVFRAGPVTLTIGFLTPLLPDDLDLLSRPISYILAQAASGDGQAHAVSIYVDMPGDWAVDRPHERVVWQEEETTSLRVLGFRSEHQPVLEKAADDQRIDWGTAYLAVPKHQGMAVVGDIDACRDGFIADGRISSDGLREAPRKVNYNGDAVLAACADLSVEQDGSAANALFLIAHDDEFSIEFLGTRLRPWWRRGDDLDGPAILERAYGEREEVVARAAEFDASLRGRAEAAGGSAYADLIDLTYRQTISAHKLAAAPDGRPFFFSKENFSNGCIATIDVTYPSAPLFLALNPVLLRAMLDPMLQYCASEAWRYPFPAHDLGTYPKANGQVYRGYDRIGFSDDPDHVIRTQMPVEEAGNMLVLGAALLKAGESPDWAEANFELFERWARYLEDSGFDPGEQLCTDDFSGTLARNVNLSAKAIMGIAGFSQMCERTGRHETGERYRALARDLAARWRSEATGPQGTLLAFGDADGWSLKYNLVWDRLLGFDLFPATARREDQKGYFSRMERYGIPLDHRSSLTKPEWMLWAASLEDDPQFFARCVDAICTYANETPSRVPFCDLYFSDTGRKMGFQARSVTGGLAIRLLEDWSVPRSPPQKGPRPLVAAEMEMA